MDYKAWPLAQAKRVLERVKNQTRTVVFETGYGPSGLPHIGTFGEVLRTSMIINAFKSISDIPTKLICFSDDMDGLRKVPENIPNRELIAKHIGQPLCSIPDPFEEEESFSAQMHKRLTNFLNRFEFEYELMTASKCYKSGLFDNCLLEALKKYDQIMEVMLPSLGEQRRLSYSPFLPICQETGKVLQVPVVERNLQAGTIKYLDPISSQAKEIQVTGGKCKLQWKPDFSMRWVALGVDFEMYGKDVAANEDIYKKICQIIGGKPPVLFTYELFLDENAQKLSKSKGNSIDIEKWLDYAPLESLKLFIYQNPERAKKLHLGVIPKCVDEYLSLNERYHGEEEKTFNPVHYIHDSKVPQLQTYGINFSLILNLAAACDADSTAVLSELIKQHCNAKELSPYMLELLQKALNYYKEVLRSERCNIASTTQHKDDLKKILAHIRSAEPKIDAEKLQTYIFELSRSSSNQKQYFKELYQILLGQGSGPRLGSLFALLGKSKSEELLESVI